MESKLWACILHLSVFFNDGIFMDVGANDGTSSLMLTQQFPNRTIFSIEPIESNIRSVYTKLLDAKNVRIIHGGLGQNRTFGEYPDVLDTARVPSTKNQVGALKNYHWQRIVKSHKHYFPIFTVDELVGERHKLAFGHWDVEGNEVDVLKGAERTILRDRPIFTVETFPRTNPTRHAELMRWTAILRYKCKKIKEVCGYPRDCRNLVCIPDEMVTTRKDLRMECE